MAKASAKKTVTPKVATKTIRKRAPRNGNNFLDDADYALLDLLQEDASRSNVKLSQSLRKKGFPLKAAACGNRKDKLRKFGYIKRIGAVLDHTKLGRPQMCFMIVKMDIKTDEAINTFLLAAKAERAITAIYEMAGFCDYLMVARAPNMEGALQLSRKLRSGVADISTYAVGHIPKEPGIVRFTED